MAARDRSATTLGVEELALAMQQRLLYATDWIETCDIPIDKKAWSDYRQSLARVSCQAGWPHDINWPKPPR